VSGKNPCRGCGGFAVEWRWNFIIMANKADSLVTKRLREEELSLPFFS
jgi:hypothetical protein